MTFDPAPADAPSSNQKEPEAAVRRKRRRRQGGVVVSGAAVVAVLAAVVVPSAHGGSGTSTRSVVIPPAATAELTGSYGQVVPQPPHTHTIQPTAPTRTAPSRTAAPAITTPAATTSTTSLGSGTTTAAESAHAAHGQALPVSVQTDDEMRAAGNAGPSSSILVPTSCVVASGTVTATGGYQGGLAPEVYPRHGDIVDLYAFTAPQAGFPDGLQVAEPAPDTSPAIGGRAAWRVPSLSTRRSVRPFAAPSPPSRRTTSRAPPRHRRSRSGR